MVALSFLFGLRAETVTNYLEKFDNMSVGKGLKFAPPSWNRISDSYYDDNGDKHVVEYKNPLSDGQDGAYLKVSDQQVLVFDDWEMDYVSYTLNDYLITPAVGGEISFYLKKTGSMYSQPNVKIFQCTKNGKDFKVGKLQKEINHNQISNSWKKFTISDVPVGTYFAFRISDAGIDEFSADTAEAGRNISMGVETANLITSAKPVTDTENKFEFTVDVTIKNIGEVDLTPGMKNYSLTVVREEEGKVVDLFTVPVDQTIKIGQTSKKIRLTAKLDAGTETKNLKYSVREDLTKNLKLVGTIETKPYRPEMILCKGQDDTALDAGLTIDFGFVKEQPSTKEFRVMNIGFAPLNITSVVLPEGYTTTFTTPATVAPNQSVNLPITLTVDKAGTFSGKLVINGEKTKAVEYDLFGAVLPKDGWLENFESNAFPSNMVVGPNWELTNYPKFFVTETNHYWAQHKTASEPSMLITPKLRVKAGETFNLRASKRSSFSNLKIYYSADRIEWKLAREINISEFSNEKLNSASDAYKFTLFTVDNIPEGNWYIGVEGGYVRVDDMYGFSLIPVKHDFYFNLLRVPEEGMVNNQIIASAGITNLAKDEKAGTYTVKYYFDGEVVGESECPKFLTSQTKAFNVTFTPHEEGEFEGYFEISAGDAVYKSAKQTIRIKAEFLEGSKTIGTNKVKSNTVPLAPFYKHSTSQTIYTAAQLGLKPGTKITKISYLGFCTSDKELIPDIAIYLENTTDAKISTSAPKNVKNMTKVYEGKYSFLKGGSEQSPVPMLTQEFSEPFVYTGGNLCIALESNARDYKYVYFMTDSQSGQTIYKATDQTLSSAPWKSSNNMPSVKIFTEQVSPVLSGKVYTEDYGPLANVKVKLISGDVWYSGVTDKSGKYSIKVVQSDKNYQAIIDEIPNYEAYTHSELINLSDGSKEIDFCVSPLSGVEGIDATAFAVYGAKGCIVVSANEEQTVNVYNIAGRLIRSVNVEKGTTSIDGLLAGFYIVNGTKVVVR